ncbi:MAG: glycosyltransferase family 4 protein [Firmicutes bacterium]|nr:glycosyltransferase family 4 protein [Bacillota bacterium]
MRILMLSWEYPPKIVGGIARHVHDLAIALVRKGIDVDVITCGVQGALEYEVDEGVKVHRISMNNPAAPDFLTWVMQLNLNLVEQANRLAANGDKFDLIHAHDWLVAYAGKNLKHSWHIPLLSTIHATEYGRNNGLHNDLQRYISNVEWWLGYESWRVIACSRYMEEELKRVFQMPGDKLRVIPNGVYPAEFRKTNLIPAKIRNRYSAPDEKIIFHIGRIVREKGLGVLLEALPRVLAVEPRVKLVIAGKGPYLDELKHRAYQLGIYQRIYFTGYIDDNTRNALYQCADVAVFPSLYEPFGIVALEGMAAGTPVVVSDTGGLSEIIQHGVNGLKAYSNNVISLADNIIWALRHPDHTVRMKQKALEDIEKIYNWDRIAQTTGEVYQQVLEEFLSSPWRRTVLRESARDGKCMESEEMNRYRNIQ